MLDMYNELGQPNGNIQANDIFFAHGAEAVHLKPVFIAKADIQSWTALADKAYFIDEDGTGQKVNGERKYFGTQEWVNATIASAITNADTRHYFDPTTEVAPTTPSASIKSGDVFVITKAGTWSGLELQPGDVLEAPADINGIATSTDFLLNQAVSGLESVPGATTSTEGIVKLIETIRTNGSADHSTVATEKAVADAIAALAETINASIAALKTLLEGQVSALNGQVTNALDAISTLQIADEKANSRLEALEAWDERTFVAVLGDGLKKEFVIPVEGVSFKNPEAVSFVTEMNVGGTYRRASIQFPVELIEVEGTMSLVARFKSVIPEGAYRVSAVGMAK